MLTIQKATTNDARRISYLIQKNTDSNPNNYTKLQIEAWKKCNTPAKIKELLKSRETFCAFYKHKLVGTIGLKSNEIVGFYISFSKRKKGIGQQLFNFIENYVIQKKIETVILTATPSALEFYKKNGFSIVKPIKVAIGDVIYQEFNMIKKL